MSPPAHVYGIGPDAAAIADPLGSASAAAMARDARILRRVAFSMGFDPFWPPPAGTRDSIRTFACGWEQGRSRHWLSATVWRPDRDAALVDSGPRGVQPPCRQ